MAFQLESLKKKDNVTFLEREWLSLVIVFFLVVAGNKTSSAVILSVAALFISFCILRSSVSNAFCWALFLVPNIRMLDGVGTTFIVNALMALPLIVCLFRIDIRKTSSVVILGSVVLGGMELLHDAALCNLDNVVSIVAWAINLFLCILVTTDSRVNISLGDIFSSFSTGIVLSALMYLAAGLTTIPNILETINEGTRFAAFADDPNYYSLYICLTLACLLNINGKNIYRFCVMLLLIGIGLLTASKMCMLLMVFELVLMILQLFNCNKENRDNKRFILWSSVGLVGLLIAFKDYLTVFIQNLIRRMGQGSNSELNLDALTSGRFSILMEYFQVLNNNTVCLLLGYGFNYHMYLTAKGAHNTYMDIILSWGLLGTIVFVGILIAWISTYRSKRGICGINFRKGLPLLILSINFLDLSCLSASMFPFVITVALLQWLPDAKKEAVNGCNYQEQ